jgi:multiple sugar transport system substrate-binding protein
MSTQPDNTNVIPSNDTTDKHTPYEPSTPTKENPLTRRNFLKYSAGAVGAASLPGLLAACAGDFGGGTVTINFWDMDWGNNSYFDVARQLVKDFNASHKGINVVYRGIPWANWYQTFTSAISSGSQPDISTGGSFMGVQFAAAQHVLPLDDVLNQVQQDGTYRDYLPGVFSPMIYQGHVITWPWAIDIRVPLYRRDLFQQAGVKVPTSWDEFRAAAKKLTGNGRYGLVESAADNITQHMLQALMINNGGGLFSLDGKLELAGNPLNTEALQYFANLVNDGSIDPASTGYQATDAIRVFGKGDAAMFFGTPGATTQMDPAAAQNVGLIPPMASPHGTQGTLYWVNNMVVYSSTQHPNETKEFLLWWIANNMPLWTKGGNSPLPIRSSFYLYPFFSSDIYQGIQSQYVPIALSANAQDNEVFPALNPLDGDGTLVTLGQDLLKKKNLTTSLQTAQSAIEKVMTSSLG